MRPVTHDHRAPGTAGPRRRPAGPRTAAVVERGRRADAYPALRAALAALLEWEARQGGFHAPAWRTARRLLGRLRDAEEARPAPGAAADDGGGGAPAAAAPGTVFVLVCAGAAGHAAPPPLVEAFAAEAAARAELATAVADAHDDDGTPGPDGAATRARALEAARRAPLPLRWTDARSGWTATLLPVALHGDARP